MNPSSNFYLKLKTNNEHVYILCELLIHYYYNIDTMFSIVF